MLKRNHGVKVDYGCLLNASLRRYYPVQVMRVRSPWASISAMRSPSGLFNYKSQYNRKNFPCQARHYANKVVNYNGV